MYVYILELESNKYYIGRTVDPEYSLAKFITGPGSININNIDCTLIWYIKYKPIRMREIISGCDMFDENKYVLKYMSIFGIDNVRGGSFSSIILKDSEYILISKMLKESYDGCFYCGECDHYIKNCPSPNVTMGMIMNDILIDDPVIINHDSLINIEESQGILNTVMSSIAAGLSYLRAF